METNFMCPKSYKITLLEWHQETYVGRQVVEKVWLHVFWRVPLYFLADAVLAQQAVGNL